MKFTGFNSNCCGQTFWVRYAVEQNASDIENCPSCGKGYEPGRFEKIGVKELKGIITDVAAVKAVGGE